MSRSERRRPFYSEFAWAFDLLIDRPVRKECSAIAAWFVERGILPGAPVLDAGCGTGRYAAEMARRGYVVDGIDLSAELIEVARRSTRSQPGAMSFQVGDIISLPAARYDGILCRGVLNDFLDGNVRRAAFASFSQTIAPGGVLILDVREWEASATRKVREPLFRKRVATDRGTLTFTSTTEVDPQNRRLIVSERHSLLDGDREHSTDYVFVMRCWTRDELDSMLRQSGFDRVAFFGAYDPGIGLGSTDRLVAVAQSCGATL